MCFTISQAVQIRLRELLVAPLLVLHGLHCAHNICIGLLLLYISTTVRVRDGGLHGALRPGSSLFVLCTYMSLQCAHSMCWLHMSKTVRIRIDELPGAHLSGSSLFALCSLYIYVIYDQNRVGPDWGAHWSSPFRDFIFLHCAQRICTALSCWFGHFTGLAD